MYTHLQQIQFEKKTKKMCMSHLLDTQNRNEVHETVGFITIVANIYDTEKESLRKHMI